MNKLSTANRVRAVSALVEGCSIRAAVHMTGMAKNTIVKLLADIGTACAEYHEKHVRDVKVARIQCDEIWSFFYSKQKNIPAEKRDQFGYGEVCTWVALDRDSKLCLSYRVGLRDGGYATEFMNDVAGHLANRVQLTTEKHARNVALHFMHYNFCRIHQSIGVTPAMQAGLADHVWEIEELVALID